MIEIKVRKKSFVRITEKDIFKHILDDYFIYFNKSYDDIFTEDELNRLNKIRDRKLFPQNFE